MASRLFADSHYGRMGTDYIIACWLDGVNTNVRDLIDTGIIKGIQPKNTKRPRPFANLSQRSFNEDGRRMNIEEATRTFLHRCFFCHFDRSGEICLNRPLDCARGDNGAQ